MNSFKNNFYNIKSYRIRKKSFKNLLQSFAYESLFQRRFLQQLPSFCHSEVLQHSLQNLLAILYMCCCLAKYWSQTFCVSQYVEEWAKIEFTTNLFVAKFFSSPFQLSAVALKRKGDLLEFYDETVQCIPRWFI